MLSYQNSPSKHHKFITSSKFISIPTKPSKSQIARAYQQLDDHDDQFQLAQIQKCIQKNNTLINKLKKTKQSQPPFYTNAKQIKLSLRNKNILNQNKITRTQYQQNQTQAQVQMIKKTPKIIQKKQLNKNQIYRNRIKTVIEQARKVQPIENDTIWRIRQLKYHGKSIFDKIDSIKNKASNYG